jgi:acyl-CoA oxidase
LIYAGKEKLEYIRSIKKLASEGHMFRKDGVFLSREAAWPTTTRKPRSWESLTPKLFTIFRNELNEQMPDTLQVDMFIPTIAGQGTPEQVKKSLPLALDYRILGTYAQTGLGHVSYLRGLETTAIYDAANVTSTKWWPVMMCHVFSWVTFPQLLRLFLLWLLGTLEIEIRDVVIR